MRRFSLLELLVAVAVLAVLVALALPQVYGMQLRAKAAEVPVALDGILAAESAYHAAHDAWVFTLIPDGYYPDAAVGKTARPWPAGSHFDVMGYKPDGEVYGTYWTTDLGNGMAAARGFTDVDADGVWPYWTGTYSDGLNKVCTGPSPCY